MYLLIGHQLLSDSVTLMSFWNLSVLTSSILGHLFVSLLVQSPLASISERTTILRIFWAVSVNVIHVLGLSHLSLNFVNN